MKINEYEAVAAALYGLYLLDLTRQEKLQVETKVHISYVNTFAKYSAKTLGIKLEVIEHGDWAQIVFDGQTIAIFEQCGYAWFCTKDGIMVTFDS